MYQTCAISIHHFHLATNFNSHFDQLISKLHFFPPILAPKFFSEPCAPILESIQVFNDLPSTYLFNFLLPPLFLHPTHFYIIVFHPLSPLILSIFTLNFHLSFYFTWNNLATSWLMSRERLHQNQDYLKPGLLHYSAKFIIPSTVASHILYILHYCSYIP